MAAASLKHPIGVRYLPFASAGLTLVLVLVNIGQRPLWLDEAFTVGATNQLADSFVQRSGSMFLYYLLVAPLVDLSVDPGWLRLPSAVAVAASVGLTVDLARRYLSPRSAVWTAALLVPMWGITRYAQEVRSYALVLLLATLAWWILFRARSEEGPRWWIALGSVWAALVYSHPLAGLIVVAQFAAMRLDQHERPGTALTRRSRPAWVVGGVLMIPMVATFFLKDEGVVPDWVPPLGRLTLSSVGETIAGPWGPGQVAVLLAIVASTCVVLRTRAEGEESWRIRSILLWLWLPLVTLTLISTSSPLLTGRFVIGSLPAAALLIGHVLSNIPSQALRVAIGLAIVISLTPGLVMLHRDPGHPWDQAIRLIEAEPSLGTASHGIIFLGQSSRTAFEVNALGSRALRETTPVSPTEAWGTLVRYYAPTDAQTIERRVTNLDVLWLVEQLQLDGSIEGRHWGVEEPFESLGFCRGATHTFGHDIEVVRFVRCP